MDFEAQRKKRMDDLAMKRKRLEEMRKQRSEKNNAAADTAPAVSPTVVAASPTPEDPSGVDDLVNSLLLGNTTEPPAAATLEAGNSPPPAAPVLSRLEHTRQRSAEWTTCQNSCSFTILPKVIEVYEKGTQTEEASTDPMEDGDDAAVPQPLQTSPYHRSPQAPRTRQRSRGDSITEGASLSSVSGALTMTYTPEEVNDIVISSSFHSFLSTSAHIVERALGLSNSFDLLRDLTGEQVDVSSSNSSDVLQRTRMYLSEAVSSRPVMDTQVSPHHAELFAASYGAAFSADSSSAGGVVCLWSLLLPQVPEFVFTSSSPVLAVRFHPENVHLLIGTCYSGQLLVWDTRNTSSTRAVQRSSSSGKGHKHPVYSMCLVRRGGSVGSGGNDWSLVTASTDGLLCTWDLDNINEPVSSSVVSSRVVPPSILPLSSSSGGGRLSDQSVVSEGDSGGGLGERPVGVTCMVLGPEEDDRKLIMGSECGTLFCFSLPFKPNSPHCKTGAHFGMITSLSLSPSTHPSFKHLLLSSSVDWTVKLWHLQTFSVGDAASPTESMQPLLVFPALSFQYITSVDWSPSHPGMFSATSSGGMLMLWNICQSVVEPVGLSQIQPDESGTGSSSRSSALNQTVWLGDGRKVLVGDSSGTTHCISIRSSTATSLRADDEERLEVALSQSHKLASASVSVSGKAVATSSKGATTGEDEAAREDGDDSTLEEKGACV